MTDKNDKNPPKSSPSPPLNRPLIGLALGSGLARGWAHIGVLRELKRHGIEPDIIAGTSMGSVVGGAYALGQLDELEEWALSLNKLSILKYLDVRVGKSGMLAGERLHKLMTKRFKKTDIENLPLPFVAVSADMTTGHEVWLREGSAVDAMRASFALPGIFPPMQRDHRWLVDGALVNPVPVSVCQALGAHMTIAVNLNGDTLGKIQKDTDFVPRVMGFDPLTDPEIPPQRRGSMTKKPLLQKLFQRKDAKTPSLLGVMINAFNITQDRLTRSRLAGDPPDIHIAPEIGDIGLMEFNRAEEIIRAGELAVRKKMPQIREVYHILSAYQKV